MLNYSLTQEQEDMIRLARDFAKKEMIPVAHEYDEKEEQATGVVKKAFDIGLMNLTLPAEYGGMGLDTFTNCRVGEELCYGCAGIQTTITANTLATVPIMIGGTEEQKKRFLSPLADAPILAAFALTEPNAGSDNSMIQTTAKREGDYYVLNGNKCFITNAGVADLYTVFATVDRSKGSKGITAFAVTADTPGISAGKKEKKMGIRASVTAEVILDNCRVPVENLLGEEGKGLRLALANLNEARIGVGAGAVGIMRRAFDEALEYSKQRVQFGKPISKNQAIQFMLADMAIMIEASRNLYWKAAWLVDNHLPAQKESAITKTFCTDSGVTVTNMALQIFGGYGYIREYPVEKLVRDIRILPILDGTNQIQRVILSGLLLRE